MRGPGTDETSPSGRPWVAALAMSLVAPPIAAYFLGALLLLTSGEWVRTTPGGGDYLTLILAGAAAGSFVACCLGLERRAHSVLPLVGLVVAVLTGWIATVGGWPEVDPESAVFWFHGPIQSLALFLVTVRRLDRSAPVQTESSLRSSDSSRDIHPSHA